MQSRRLARGLIFALCLLSPLTMIPAFKALGMIQIQDQGAPTQACYGYGYGYSSCTTTTSKTSTTHTTVSTTTSTTTSGCKKCRRISLANNPLEIS